MATTGDHKLAVDTPNASLAPRTSDQGSLVNRRELTVSRSQLRSAVKASARARRKTAPNARREADRAARRATLRAVRGADLELWTTEELNLWNGPGGNAARIGLVDALDKVLVTGRREAERAEIVVDGESRWVTATYLVDTKPTEPDPPESGPALGGQCANGSSITAGRAALYEIFDTVCANWPQITSYGT